MGTGASLGERGEGTTNGQDDNRTSMLRHEQDHKLTGQNQSSKDRQHDRSHEHYARRDYIASGARVEGEHRIRAGVQLVGGHIGKLMRNSPQDMASTGSSGRRKIDRL